MSKIPGDPGYKAGWCIHYRYNRGPKTPENDTCEAGVRFDTFNGDDRSFERRPCFIKPDEQPSDRAHCPKLRPPTPEEISAHEAWLESRLNTLTTVMEGISGWRAKHKGRSAQEVVECPACKGRLHLSISAYNGHVHGNCETEGCAQWME